MCCLTLRLSFYEKVKPLGMLEKIYTVIREEQVRVFRMTSKLF